MKIFIALLVGILIGRLIERGRKLEMERPMNVILLLMVFFMGVETGKVEVNAIWLVVSSLVFAVFNMAGSLGAALLLGGGK
ncbi:hypothetical protein [Thermococcus sp.]|uniref:hypothetical protein n=1 Tax=Thermococcus sp. TaxID=35749 RepID=UPI00261326CF|nr:hypothetical protein [Thermococcus sp.]